jgi:endonuclease III
MLPSDFVEKLSVKYLKKEGIFHDARNAEDYVPPHATKLQKSLFLFYIIQLDYAIKGKLLYEGGTKLFQETPEFFSPQYILNLDPQKLQLILQEYLKPRYINEACKRYICNSEILLSKFEGDPLNLFQFNSAKSVLAEIRKLRGMGPKIGNLFFRTMVNTFDLQYTDMIDILQPVDIHDVRIAYLLGYLNSDLMTEQNISETKLLWQKACNDANINWLIFDKALWLFGSIGKPKTKDDILNILL